MLSAEAVRERYDEIRAEAGPGVTVVAATKYVSPDLVAARTDRGADRRYQPTADGGGARLDDSLEQAEPSRVEDRKRRAVPAGDRDRHAVCRELEHRDARVVGPETVSRLPATAGVRAVNRRGMRLAVQGQAVVVGADGRAEPATVLLDALRPVAGHAAEVE